MTRNKPIVPSSDFTDPVAGGSAILVFSRVGEGRYQFKMFAKCAAGIKQIYYGAY